MAPTLLSLTPDRPGVDERSADRDAPQRMGDETSVQRRDEPRKRREADQREEPHPPDRIVRTPPKRDEGEIERWLLFERERAFDRLEHAEGGRVQGVLFIDPRRKRDDDREIATQK